MAVLPSPNLKVGTLMGFGHEVLHIHYINATLLGLTFIHQVTNGELDFCSLLHECNILGLTSATFWV